jgi:hypothetical protein
MTANQITKQLVKLGFSLEGLTIGRDKIEVYVHTVGYVDNKNERILNKIMNAMKLSGYARNTQYGAWILYINQRSNEFVRNNID